MEVSSRGILVLAGSAGRWATASAATPCNLAAGAEHHLSMVTGGPVKGREWREWHALCRDAEGGSQPAIKSASDKFNLRWSDNNVGPREG